VRICAAAVSAAGLAFHGGVGLDKGFFEEPVQKGEPILVTGQNDQ